MSYPHSHQPNCNGYSMGPPKGSPRNAKTYYPFSTDLSPYPYNIPYNIPYPPTSLFYLCNKNHPYAQGSPYSAPNQRLGPLPTNRGPFKKGVIEVIDLEKPLIKVEPSESQKIKIKKPELKEQSAHLEAQNSVNLIKSEIKINEQHESRSQKLQQIFQKLLTSFASCCPNYQQAYKQFRQSLYEINQLPLKNEFCHHLNESLEQKFRSFKKTKEELIKYIIRRTYHNAKHRKNASYKLEYQKLEQFHERNLKLHKSMNHEFLKKQFSNSIFVLFYQEFLDQIDEQFDKENNERIERFAATLASAWIEETLTMVQYEKKLPWVYAYKVKIRTLARDLVIMYQHPQAEHRTQ